MRAMCHWFEQSHRCSDQLARQFPASTEWRILSLSRAKPITVEIVQVYGDGYLRKPEAHNRGWRVIRALPFRRYAFYAFSPSRSDPPANVDPQSHCTFTYTTPSDRILFNRPVLYIELVTMDSTYRFGT